MVTAKQTKPSELDLSDEPAHSCDVFLVDGNGLAYRGFYALPEELQTVDGQPTNALLGMANMLMRLLVDYRPKTVLVAWDERPTRRLELDPDYKAHRKPTPDLLKAQQPYFAPLVEAFGYRNLRVEGNEADDVIGTLVTIAEAQGHSVCVVSTDRDAFQLASDKVCIMMTPRGVSDVVVYTPERIRQRYGIGPEQIPDFIGLKGDTSDNILGVPGIGDKTAAELLIQFGTMEGVYEHLDEVSGTKRRETLATASRRRREVEAAGHHRPRRAARGRLQRAGRESARSVRDEGAVPQARVPGPAGTGRRAGGGGAGGGAGAGRHRRVPWRAAGVAELKSVPHEVALASDGSRFAVAAAEGEALLLDVPERAVLDALRDRRVLTHGLKLPALTPAGDTQIAAYLIDPGRSDYAIADLREEAGLELRTQAEPETAELILAAATSARLHARLLQRVEEREMGPLYRDIELPLIPVLADMERTGVRIDSYRLAEIAAKLADQVDELEATAYELAGGPFTLGSPKQLGEVLFERLGLPADRKGKTGYSTDARVLAKLRDMHPIIDVVEAWREQSKLLSTYLQPLPELIDEEGRLHTTFSQTTAATGRLSSIRPNLQNIPVRTPLGREIRSAFVAADGFQILSADYSQVELRILAHLSGEPALKEAFARGEDIHRATAAQVLGRDPATLTSDGAQPRQGRQLRDHLRHQRLRPVGAAGHLAGGGAELHRPLPGALPGGQRVHRDGDRVGQGARLRDHAVRAAAADPRAAGGATTRPAAWASGWP